MSKFEIPDHASNANETSTRLEFRFLLAGARPDDATRIAIHEELNDLIDNLVHLHLIGVNRGLQLDLEVTTTAPFGNAGFEAYLIDHILEPVLIRAAQGDPVSIRPLRSRRV